MINLKSMTTEKLCELFEQTENMSDENIPTVRGWLMDEIEMRNPEGFNKWLDSDDCSDSKLRNFIFNNYDE